MLKESGMERRRMFMKRPPPGEMPNLEYRNVESRVN
jgi:hypothetical protein